MGILWLLGAIGLVVALSEDSDDSESDTESPPAAPPPQRKRDNIDPNIAEYFKWTLGSIVLERKPDLYNPGDIAERVKKNRQRAAASNEAKLVADIQALEIKVMDLATGGYASAIWNLLQSIAKFIVGESSGGFDALRPLSRKMILFCLPGSLAEMSLLNLPKPPKSAEPQLWSDYFRQVLITYRKAIEFDRMVEVDDQVIPPLPVLAYLAEKKLWPPPIEPAPPVSGSVLTEYSGLGSWASGWVSLHPIESYLYPAGAALPAQAAQLASEVYSQLQDEYHAQTEGIRQVLGLCQVPPQLAGLVRGAGSYPRIGSSAAPVRLSPGDLGI